MHNTQYLEDVDFYFDISFLKFQNLNLEDADCYSEISYLKLQT